jgi:tripartite-type tricarboxylate transporter receptor subunit TctC
MNTSMRTLIAWIVSGLAATVAPLAIPQERSWPSKPIRLIVPGGPGGVIDIRARWLAERLTPLLGQSVYVENRSGADGNIGTAQAAHSAADGYTLVIVHPGTMTINPHLYAHTGYDPLRDLIPITSIGVGPLIFAVNLAVPAKSVAEFIALAKAQPGRLTFGSPGIGSPPHMAAELFKRLAEIDATHVPYRGGGAAASDLIAGHINFSIEGLTVQLPFIRTGQVRALAVTGSKRVAVLPDVPTMAEAGVTGYEYEGWVGIAAPAGTPQPIVQALYRASARALSSVEARDWFASFGLEPGADSPEAFASLIGAEYAKWGRVIREAGIKAQ